MCVELLFLDILVSDERMRTTLSSAVYTSHDGICHQSLFLLSESKVTLRVLVEFLGEATMMKDFRHENVLPLVGVAVQNGLPFVMTPLMEKGDLKDYILPEKDPRRVGVV